MRFLSRFFPACLLASGLLLLPGTPWASESGDLRVLVEPLGLAAMNRDGESAGWAVDIVREIMHRTGTETPIELMPWARAINVAQDRPNVILCPVVRTREREEHFHWVGPIFRVKWYFLARKGSGITINSLDDARKVRSIGTYIDDARDHYLMSLGFTNLERSANNATNYRKLEYGRLDLIVGSNSGLAAMSEAAGVNPDNFEPVFELTEVDLYLALSPKTASDTATAWRQAFRSMREDGTFAAILHRWYPGMEPPMDERIPWRGAGR